MLLLADALEFVGNQSFLVDLAGDDTPSHQAQRAGDVV